MAWESHVVNGRKESNFCQAMKLDDIFNSVQPVCLSSIAYCGHGPLMGSFDLSTLPDSDLFYPYVTENITQEDSSILFSLRIDPISFQEPSESMECSIHIAKSTPNFSLLKLADIWRIGIPIVYLEYLVDEVKTKPWLFLTENPN